MIEQILFLLIVVCIIYIIYLEIKINRQEDKTRDRLFMLEIEKNKKARNAEVKL